MLFTPLTISVSVLSLLAITLVVRRIAQDRMGIGSGFLWAVAWSTLGIIAVFPDLLNALLEVSQMRNRVLFALVLSAVFLLGIVFSLSSRIERTERTAHRAHQELALTNAQLEKLARLIEAKGRDA
jgi:hypothetical protein